jgi:hypothetical protein
MKLGLFSAAALGATISFLYFQNSLIAIGLGIVSLVVLLFSGEKNEKVEGSVFVTG